MGDTQLFIDENTTFIDLFAGIGGFRCALEQLGAKCVWSSEIDKYACMTYEHNFHDDPSNDITKTDATDIPHMDIICGGFPCQAFSISGKQRGFEDARGTLFYDVLRIAEHHKPKMLFLENVANLKQHDGGNTFRVMRACLDKAGYEVFDRILVSADYRVPQLRKRIYIVCIRKDIAAEHGISQEHPFEFPEPMKDFVVLDDILDRDEATTETYRIDRPDTYMELSDKQMEKLTRQPKPIRIGHVNKGCQGERIYSTKGTAITLSAYGGGAGAKTGLYLVDGVVRKLSPAECLRVQGFPDWYEFPAISDSQRWKQTGNSVSVPVLHAIMDAANAQLS